MLYSLDLRKRVVDAVNKGMSKSEACRVFRICRQTVYSWLHLQNTQGNLNPITGFQKGHSHKITDLNSFKEYVDQNPDKTQIEMADDFNVSKWTIGRVLKKIGYSRKKKSKLYGKK